MVFVGNIVIIGFVVGLHYVLRGIGRVIWIRRI